MIINIMERFKNIGLKLTPQRVAILEYLDGNTSHPSAEDIYRHVKERFPMISFATVYNTLEALRKRGLILELTIDPDRKRYDPNIHPHHHLICLRCKSVVDVNLEFDVPVPDDVRGRFEILGNHIEFYGICEQCKKEGGDDNGSL
ncbi:MAG: transcriptional repressor [Nitrospirae bacterium]|nr:transcriptional repressor [Nitrospirota bacterium]